jgi:hypothetical protein
MPQTNITSPVQSCGMRPAPPVPKKPDEKHFVSFKIVDDKGKPVCGVVLLIKLPDGSKEEHTTGKDCMIEIKGIKPGNCSILSDWHKLKACDVVLLKG